MKQYKALIAAVNGDGYPDVMHQIVYLTHEVDTEVTRLKKELQEAKDEIVSMQEDAAGEDI